MHLPSAQPDASSLSLSSADTPLTPTERLECPRLATEPGGIERCSLCSAAPRTCRKLWSLRRSPVGPSRGMRSSSPWPGRFPQHDRSSGQVACPGWRRGRPMCHQWAAPHDPDQRAQKLHGRPRRGQRRHALPGLSASKCARGNGFADMEDTAGQVEWFHCAARRASLPAAWSSTQRGHSVRNRSSSTCAKQGGTPASKRQLLVTRPLVLDQDGNHVRIAGTVTIDPRGLETDPEHP